MRQPRQAEDPKLPCTGRDRLPQSDQFSGGPSSSVPIGDWGWLCCAVLVQFRSLPPLHLSRPSAASSHTLPLLSAYIHYHHISSARIALHLLSRSSPSARQPSPSPFCYRPTFLSPSSIAILLPSSSSSLSSVVVCHPLSFVVVMKGKVSFTPLPRFSSTSTSLPYSHPRHTKRIGESTSSRTSRSVSSSVSSKECLVEWSCDVDCHVFSLSSPASSSSSPPSLPSVPFIPSLQS